MSESDWDPEPGSDPGGDADFPEDPLLEDEEGGELEPAEPEDEEEDW